MGAITEQLSEETTDLVLDGVRHGTYRILVGAGFSSSSKDATGQSLPLAGRLAIETAAHFGLPDRYALGQLANAIEPTSFSEYLVRRFSGCSGVDAVQWTASLCCLTESVLVGGLEGRG